MNHFLALIVALLIATSLGCNMVTLDAAIGDPLSPSEKAAFVGRWINDDSEVCELRQTNDGKLVMGSISWDSTEQQHRVENHVIDARKVGAAIYFLAHDDPKNIGFVRIERTGESEFKMHMPDASKFRAAVEKGDLQGKIVRGKSDNYTVRIHVDSPLTNPIFSAVQFSDWYADAGTQGFRCIKRFDEGPKAKPRADLINESKTR